MGQAISVSKISTKSCGVGKAVIMGLVKESDTAIPVLRAYGVVSDVKKRETPIGESYCFIGTHEAVNLLNGEQFTSRQAYLPGLVSDMLLEKVGRNKGNCEYAFDITAEYFESATGEDSYRYGAIDYRPDAESPLTGIAESLPPLPGQDIPEKPVKKTAKKKR